MYIQKCRYSDLLQIHILKRDISFTFENVHITFHAI